MTAIIYFGEILVASSLAIVLLAISQLRMSSDAVLFAAGVVAWTLAEYVVHRFVLHGIAPTEHRQHHANPDGAVLTIFITKAIVDLQLEISASAQRCGIVYSGRCLADPQGWHRPEDKM